MKKLLMFIKKRMSILLPKGINFEQILSALLLTRILNAPISSDEGIKNHELE